MAKETYAYGKRDLRVWQTRSHTSVMAAVRLLGVDTASGGVSRREPHAWERFYARVLQQHLV